ncbi:MAG: DCC1-like thiol-disulfide oxidoreductase family protein [Geminicoccaceae bacterium]
MGDPSEAWLVYDGQCPFCSRYARLVRIRENVRLHLVDARKSGPLVREVSEAGLDLNEGMVLKMGGRYYHGAAALQVLAALSTSSTTFNRLSASIFRSPYRSRALYPILRVGRNAALAVLGREKIRDSSAPPRA